LTVNRNDAGDSRRIESLLQWLADSRELDRLQKLVDEAKGAATATPLSLLRSQEPGRFYLPTQQEA
jgi:hypothetical protein